MVASVAAHKGATCSLAHHPSQPLLVSGGADGVARVWGPAGGEDDMQAYNRFDQSNNDVG